MKEQWTEQEKADVRAWAMSRGYDSAAWEQQRGFFHRAFRYSIEQDGDSGNFAERMDIGRNLAFDEYLSNGWSLDDPHW